MEKIHKENLSLMNRLTRLISNSGARSERDIGNMHSERE